jgi:zinc protease
MTFTSTSLPNGICVGIDQNPHSNGVSVRILIRAAARHDTVPGCAHFLEHCIAHSAAPSGRSVTDVLDEICLYSNFWTGKERILCLADTSREHLPDVLDLLARALLNPAYDAATLERERARILHEEEERRATTPAYGILERRIFGNHPFANTVLGSRSSIKAMQPADLEAFHQNHITGSNMGIIVSGPLDPAQTLSLIECAFAPIPKGRPSVAQSLPAFLPAPRQSIQKSQDMQTLNVYLEQVSPAPEQRTSSVALSALLQNELNTRLSRSALNYSGACADYLPYSDLAYCEIGLSVSPENANAGLSLISDTLHDARSWLTPEALETLKKQWRMSSDFNNNDPRQRVRLMTAEYELSGNMVPWRELDDRYDRVTIETVRDALHRLDLANAAFLSVGPAGPPWPEQEPAAHPAIPLSDLSFA